MAESARDRYEQRRSQMSIYMGHTVDFTDKTPFSLIPEPPQAFVAAAASR